MLEKIKKYKFCIGIILISLIYFILTSVQNPKFIYYAGADDYLVLSEARNLLDFKWLGDFNARTLSKGPGTQIFVAIANILGLTFVQAEFLLYIGCSILFVHVLKKVIKNDYVRLFIFIIILFNPIVYTSELLRVYRDNVNTSFLLYVVSCCLGIFFNYREEIKKIIPYMIGLGVFASWMALTREEAVWIVPFTIGSCIITSLFILFDKKCLGKKKKILLYLIPISIYLFSIFIVCTFNKIEYGEFVRIEQNSKAYKDFIKAISSIDVKSPKLKVDVSTEARKKVYEISPTFAELEDILEREDNSGYKIYGDISGEIENGWFQWAIYDALDKKGYSTDLKTLNNYFRKVTNDINKAFEDGKLKKEDNPVSIFNKENLNLVFENIKKAFEFQINLEDFEIRQDIDNYVDEGNPDVLKDRKDEFFEISGGFPTNSYTYNYKTDLIKITLLIKIFKIYQVLSKPLFIIGLVIYLLTIIKFLFVKPKFENYKELIILTSLLMLYFIRLVVIAYVETKLCPGICISYLSSTYSLQFSFDILSLVFLITEISKKIKEKRNN